MCKIFWMRVRTSAARRKFSANGCVKNRLNIRPNEAEQIVLEQMRARLAEMVIAKVEKQKLDNETESIKVELIRIDDELRNLSLKISSAEGAMYDFIQSRVNELYPKKADLEERLRTKARKQKEIDTEPLNEPLARWDELSAEDKHSLAMLMIDVVYISDEHGVEVKFAI